MAVTNTDRVKWAGGPAASAAWSSCRRVTELFLVMGSIKIREKKKSAHVLVTTDSGTWPCHLRAASGSAAHSNVRVGACARLLCSGFGGRWTVSVVVVVGPIVLDRCLSQRCSAGRPGRGWESARHLDVILVVGRERFASPRNT